MVRMRRSAIFYRNAMGRVSSIAILLLLLQPSSFGTVSKDEIIEQLRRSVPSWVIEHRARSQGITFAMDEQIADKLRRKGASESLIRTLFEISNKNRPMPPEVQKQDEKKSDATTGQTSVQQGPQRSLGSSKKSLSSSTIRSPYGQRDPKIVAVLNKAQELDKSGDIDGALANYREAVRMDPRDSYLHLSLADCLELEKHDYDGAVAEFLAGARVDDMGMRYYFHRLAAEALEKKGDWQGALDEYRISKKMNSKYGGFPAPDKEADLLERIRQASAPR
jgi:tetratricopeptide (TPR) repeat protein